MPLLVMLQQVIQGKEILQTVFFSLEIDMVKLSEKINLKEGTNTKQKIKASHSVKS